MQVIIFKFRGDSALKARIITAQGVALGLRKTMILALKGRINIRINY